MLTPTFHLLLEFNRKYTNHFKYANLGLSILPSLLIDGARMEVVDSIVLA